MGTVLKRRVRFLRKPGRRIPGKILVNERGGGHHPDALMHLRRQKPDSVAVLNVSGSPIAEGIELLEPRLLMPWRNPVWLQYVSHKIGRLVVPYALLTLMASSMALADRSIVFAAALGAQCVFYLLAGYGAWLDLCGTTASSRIAPLSVTWPSMRPPDRRGAINV